MEHNQKELGQIEQHNQHMMKQMKSVLNNINSNEFLNQVKNENSESKQGKIYFRP